LVEALRRWRTVWGRELLVGFCVDDDDGDGGGLEEEALCDGLDAEEAL